EMLSEKIEEVLRQTKQKASSGVSEVIWLNQTIPVRSAKIHGIITRVQEDIKEVESVTLRDAKLKLYSRLLMDCQEALQAIKDEIGVEKKFKFR
ncbi:hypothetical protein, partial [Salmonella sp. s51228]|uniref:hypothetical protein n=1 Tax=Salmonella sp. s51228 TaxID=3159652 RepID=UPI00397E9E72